MGALLDLSPATLHNWVEDAERADGLRGPVIVAYIDGYRDRFGVEPICAVLSEHGCTIEPSPYYARTKTPVTDAELEEAYLVNALVDLHRANWGVYRVRKLWHPARRAGLQVGRDQVGRLMAIAGITGVVQGRRRTVTTRSDRSARDTRTWSSVVGTPRPGSTNCGLRTYPMCGRWPGSSTWRSVSSASPESQAGQALPCVQDTCRPTMIRSLLQDRG